MILLPGLADRYVVTDLLDEGGMGSVYRGFDKTLNNRKIAIKTIRDSPDPKMLELFRKEWQNLASLNHPNVVKIYDVAEFRDGDSIKPYFVMPLLSGGTFADLIKNAKEPIAMERIINIIGQTCLGLYAAHAKGLVHRDLKPSNIFVMDDDLDSVQIIDFGVAHLVEDQTTMGFKGTLRYTAPELLPVLEGDDAVGMQRTSSPTPASDQYSLGVICYEVLARCKLFEGKTKSVLMDAIKRDIPPPISRHNPRVNLAMDQVIHKAMAKDPRFRFATVREFGEYLQKAYRNQPIAIFDSSRVEARLNVVRDALSSGSFHGASDILTELESEGHLHPDIGRLRQEVDAAVRERHVQELIERARLRFSLGEYQTALQRVSEALALNPTHPQALALKAEIDENRHTTTIGEWLRLARQHLDNGLYAEARKAIGEVLELRPSEPHASQLLLELQRREKEHDRLCLQKKQYYAEALDAESRGDLSSAVTKMKSVLECERQAPESTAGEIYRKEFERIQSEHSALNHGREEARAQLELSNFAAALDICHEWLRKYPDDALFRALKLEAGSRERQERSTYIASVEQEWQCEPDLERQIAILNRALERYKDEVHFRDALDLVQNRRRQIERARSLEGQGRIEQALEQWSTIRLGYPQYPGLQAEIQRLQEVLQRANAKTRWVDEVRRYLGESKFIPAEEVCREALVEFPEDADLMRLQQECRDLTDRSARVQPLLQEAQDCLSTNLQRSRELVNEVLRLEPANIAAQALDVQIKESSRQEAISGVIANVRALETSGKIREAEDAVSKALAEYGEDPRLRELQGRLKTCAEERQRAVDELRGLERTILTVGDSMLLDSIFERSQTIAHKYREDAELQTIIGAVERKAQQRRRRLEARTRHRQWTAGVGRSLRRLGQTLKSRMVKIAAVTRQVPAYVRPLVRDAVKQSTKPFSASNVSNALRRGKLAGNHFFHTLRRAGRLSGPGLRGFFHVHLVKLLASFGIVLVAVLCVTGALYLRKTRLAREAAAARVPVQIAVVPANAELRVNPKALSVRLFVRLTGAAVSLDGERIEPSGGNWFVASNVRDGTHSLEVTVASVRAKIHFDAASASAPRLLGPIETKDALALALTYAPGTKAQLFTSSGPALVNVAGKDLGPIDPTHPAEVELTPGDWPVTVQEGGRRDIPFSLEIGDVPFVALFLRTDLGQIDVAIQPSDAEVRLERQGRQLSGSQQRSRWVFPNREPGEYILRAEKDGYESYQEAITLAKGGHLTKVFELVERPKKGTLEITGVPEGLDGAILLDGKEIGRLRSAFRYSEVDPGIHTLFLAVRHYDVEPITKRFSAGEITGMSFAEFKTRIRHGTLDASGVEPASLVTATLRDKKGSSRPYKLADQSPRGLIPLEFDQEYEVEFSAPGFKPRTKTGAVQDIPSGNVFSVGRFTLEEIPKPLVTPKPQPVTRTLLDWDNPNVWESDGDGWRQYKQGKSVEIDVSDGTITFEIKFTGTARWRLDFTNGDFVSLELKRDRLIRSSNRERSKTPEIFGMNSERRRVQIVMRDGHVEHSVSDGAQLTKVDDVALKTGLNGKFKLTLNNKTLLKSFQYLRFTP